ncbi:MAG: hypothetical protein Q8862_04495 [Bacteroidota bacterium]|nr:hypothetical protein [Bacteroidota bacterium]MDP4206699.1 hypothetical protein [Bacteroidota bacterium]
MLPKFLLADNSQEVPESLYIVHTEQPRFIVGFDIEDFWQNQEITWIDEKPENEELIEQLLEEADDFLEKEFENEENIDEEDEE